MDLTELISIRKKLTNARRHEIIRQKKQAARSIRRRMTLASAAWMMMIRKVLNAKIKAGLTGKTATEIADNLIDWKWVEDQGRRIFLSSIDLGHGTGWELAMPKVAKFKASRMAKDVGGSNPGPYIPLKGPQPEAAYKWSLEHTGELITEITERTRQGIIGFIAPRIVNGKSNQAIARDLRTNNVVGLTEKQTAAVGNYWSKLVDGGMDEETADERAGRYADRLLAYRTDTIARTETSYALNEGIRSAYKENDIKYLERVEDPVGDPDECREDNGSIYSVDDAEGVLPAHPNCLLPGTMVIPAGQILAGFRASYRGPVFRIITASGDKLTVPSNHQFLTDRGFKRAAMLRNGDNFIKARLRNPGPANPDDDRQPAAIEDIIETLAVAPGSTTAMMPTAPEYFHGDGFFLESDIEIIAAKGKLMNRKEPSLAECLGYEIFKGRIAGPSHLSAPSDLDSVLFGLVLAADGRMGLFNDSLTINGIRYLGPHQKPGLASGPEHNSSVTQSSGDRGPADIIRLRDLLERFPGFVTTDQIISIEQDFYIGHIFNLQTETTVYMTGEGIVNSNCEGTWVYAEGPDEGDTQIPAEEVQMMAKHSDQFAKKRISLISRRSRKRLTKPTRPQRLTRSRRTRHA